VAGSREHDNDHFGFHKGQEISQLSQQLLVSWSWLLSITSNFIPFVNCPGFDYDLAYISVKNTKCKINDMM
jgi:hypothetical protein